MVQLTNHMGVTKTACGILSNGYVAHFCTINSAGELVADGPYEMSTPLFWKTLVTFIRYAVDQPPLSVQLSLKAAASGALDDDVDRTGEGENMAVKITGPALPRSFDCENYQLLLNDGKNDRPMVWVRNIEGQDVVVKAVNHDPSGFLLSELAHEIDVYDRLHEKGARDFIPEFVISGKLPGGDRSAIVTKFAGDSVEFWKPKDKSEAMEVYNKAVDALSKLHKLGYLHGDVVLRNFVLDPKSRKVRVIDLGRAEELDEQTNPGYEVDELKSEFRRSFPRYFE